MLKFFIDAPENMVCSQAERFGRSEVLLKDRAGIHWRPCWCAMTFHGNLNICCDGETQVLPLRIVNITDESDSGASHSLEIGFLLDKVHCAARELAEMDEGAINNQV